MCAENVLQNSYWGNILFFFMLLSKLKCNHQKHIKVALKISLYSSIGKFTRLKIQIISPLYLNFSRGSPQGDWDGSSWSTSIQPQC